MKIKKLVQFVVVTSCMLTEAKKPPKLKNFGATCFQNATIQALYNIQPITHYLASNQALYTADSLPDLYQQLIYQLEQRTPKSTAHYNALKQLAPKGYELVEKCTPEQGCIFLEECKQEDATEFMAGLLNSLMSYDNNFAHIPEQQLLEQHPIGQLIAVGLASTINCPSINYSKITITPSAYFTVETQKVEEKKGQLETTLFTTLDECLQQTFAIEHLTDPQSYYKLQLSDQETQSRPDLIGEAYIPNCSKKSNLASTSEIVIISLKRFAYNIYGDQIKLDHIITIPQHINFEPFMISTAPAHQPNYNLISAIHHSGGTGGGHYIAYIKSNGQWYVCDDTFIQRQSWHAIQDAINKSYVLIYQKMTPRQEKQLARKRKQQEEQRRQQENLTNSLKGLSQALEELSAHLKV